MMRLGKRNAATISRDAKCKREKGLLKTAVQVFSFVCLQNEQKKIAIFQFQKKITPDKRPISGTHFRLAETDETKT